MSNFFLQLSASRMSMLTTAVFAVSLVWLFSNAAQAANAPLKSSYPGGVAELSVEKLSEQLPEIKFGLREPVIIDQGSDWRVLVGLDLSTLPGEYLIYIKPAIKGLPARQKKFRVEQRDYPLDSKPGSPILNLSVKHEQFSELDYSNTQQPDLPLFAPAAGQWNDAFGHSAFDPKQQQLVRQNLVSLTTTEVLTVSAPQNAIVSKITMHEDQSATVFLDHGRGLYSIISGIVDLTVETGNGIVRGAVIGKLMAPTAEQDAQVLTWQCVLNGAYVNPFILAQN